MSFRDAVWPQGTPCWFELAAADQDAAIAYYGELFGWHITPGPPETGGYAMADLGGRAVAGIAALMTADQPTVWTTYLASADVDVTAAKITAAGGTIIAAPMDVLDLGRMAIAQDPAGGVFGIWQANSHLGAGVVNEPGAPIWNELLTPDYEAAKAFYASVFDVSLTEIGGDDFQFATIEVESNTVGGIGATTGERPYWRMYFGSADADATMADAARLGGTIVLDPHDTPFGRWGTVADPRGAQFSIITPPAAG